MKILKYYQSISFLILGIKILIIIRNQFLIDTFLSPEIAEERKSRYLYE